MRMSVLMLMTFFILGFILLGKTYREDKKLEILNA
jgi:hypothetical protein